jgi:phage baseplate assembly protein W
MANERFFYSDYDGSFTRASDGDVTRDKDVNAILNSLSNIILTLQGERRMLPTFASNISYLLFEPIDEITARLIAENLIDAIRIWEDRINITGFDIEPLYDDNAYRCRINFTIVGSDVVETVNFILTR